MQAKHQPLQFLNVSTLREYLRFEFLDLVGEALEPPPASDLTDSDPWHQEEDLPEPAPEDDDRGTGPEGNAGGPGLEGSDADDDSADAADPHAVRSDAEDSHHSNSISAQASTLDMGQHMPRGAGVNADGLVDFERVLQDFVLLTFLVGLSTPVPPPPPPPLPPPPPSPQCCCTYGCMLTVQRVCSGSSSGMKVKTHPSCWLQVLRLDPLGNCICMLLD